MKSFIYNTLLMTAGSALCAVAVNGFLKPHGFLSGGITGIALIVHYSSQNIPFGILYLFINIPIFLLGLLFVGFRFILFTAWGIVIYSLMLLMVIPDITVDDKLLSVLVAGAIFGMGVAIMLRSNGTAGGTVIISVILNKLYSVSHGGACLIINAVILTISGFMFPLENVFYTLAFIIISAGTMNFIFENMAKRKAVMIISERWKDILCEITLAGNIGVTLLSAKGGYKGCEKTVLYSIVKNKNIGTLKSIALSKDPSSFIAVMETTDIINSTVGNQPPWK